MKISIAATTDIGNGRENNEDAFAVCPDLSQPDWKESQTKEPIPLSDEGALVVVADGMGGTNAGEVASAVAIETVKNEFAGFDFSDEPLTDEQAVHLLSTSVRKADEAINSHIYEHPETAGMGTTIVICWITDSAAYVAWCGDSRCYLYNDKEGLRQLTKDHSYVQELVDKGEITKEQAFAHPDNNVITRGLGDFDSQAKADIHICHVLPDDSFLLCSDGLCGYCTDEQIARVMASCRHDTAKCTDELQQMALKAGSEDNICIAVATVTDESTRQPSKLQRIIKSIFG